MQASPGQWTHSLETELDGIAGERTLVAAREPHLRLTCAAVAGAVAC